MPPQSAISDPIAQESTLAARRLLMLLVAGDLLFIFLHVVHVETRWLRGAWFSLEVDGGLPEMYQYAKQFSIAILMAITFGRTRIALYAAWAIVFAFLTFDDAAQVHERVGFWLGQRYELPVAFGLRPDDIGELLFAAMVGASMLLLVGLAARRGGDQPRRVSRDILCLIIVLAFLGVVIDTLHVIAYFAGSLLAQVLLLIEDGGEMMVVSALTAYAFHVARHRGRTHFDLWGRFVALVTTRWRARAAEAD